MSVRQQGAEAGHVRARHRRTAEHVELLPWFPSGATAARMSSPGAMKSGFMMSSPPIPARPGPRDENAATNGAGWSVTTVPFEIVAGALGFAARYVRIVFPTVWLTWIDRHEVQVGVHRVLAGVRHDHPEAALLGDLEALVDPGVDAAVAEHDLARHLRGIERAEEAEAHLVGVRTREAGRGRQDPRASRRLRGDRAAFVRDAADRDRAEAVRLCVPAATEVKPRADVRDREVARA